jgi:hypothetical protein
MRAPGKIRKKVREKCERWLEQNVRDGRIRALAREYWQVPIVLYTGSGVSTCLPVKGKAKRYGLPTWFPLLAQVSGQPESKIWPEDPWLAADEAVGLCEGPDEFKRRLKQLIRSAHNYRGKGQLSGTFVSNAGTLRAIAAFCGQLTGRIVDPQKENPKDVYYRSAANPRVSAVLTANYDCFLESAGSNLYRNSPLKPVTALGSQAGSMSRIPVYHVHGYIPHSLYQSESREQTIDELIITKEDYEKYWKSDDVFGTTMGPQIHYLRYFTVLFIGFSFVDEYVCKLLRRVYNNYLSRAGRTHFALLEEKRVQERGESFFLDMGVTPIVYQSHDEIPCILGQVYKAGLATDRIVTGEEPAIQTAMPELLTKTHTPTQRSYHYSNDNIWNIMLACSNGSVNVNKVRELEIVGN